MSACANQTVPNARDYFQGMSTAILVLVVFDFIVVICIIVMFGVQVWVIDHYVSVRSYRSRLKWLAAVFPVTAIASITAICVPRALSIMETFILLYFARCLFTFMGTIRVLFGGRKKMSESLKGESLKLAVPPCCCCCVCLPKLQPDRSNLKLVEMMTYQVAVVRSLTLFVQLVMTADGGVHQSVYTFLNVVSSVSTLFAMYGCLVMTNIVKTQLEAHKIRTTFAIIQALLFFTNIQGAVFDFLANTNIIKCDSLLPATPRAHVWHHLALIPEVMLIMVGTWYIRPAVNEIFDRHPNHESPTRRSSDATATSIPNYGTCLDHEAEANTTEITETKITV